MEKASQSRGVLITRIDKLEADFVLNESSVAMQEMAIGYPEETKILIEDVLRIGSVKDLDVESKLKDYFVKDSMRYQLVKDVVAKFDNLGVLGKNLKKAFSDLQRKMPGMHIPQFYAQISGFNQSVVVGDSILGISLDKYMGADYKPYKKIYYQYQIDQMRSSHIVGDCLYFWLESKYPLRISKDMPLLDVMVYFGKINWAVYHILGDELKDDKKLYYLKSDQDTEGEWAEMTKKLFKKNVLSLQDKQTVRHVMFGSLETEMANVKGLQGVGVPAGLKIVDDYMQHHPDCSLSQLFAMTNAAQLLREAGYTVR